MKVDELERAEEQRPFRPSEIRTADGRSITARNPDSLAWDPESPRIALCVTEGGGRDIIDAASITSPGIPAPKRSADGPSAGDDAA